MLCKKYIQMGSYHNNNVTVLFCSLLFSLNVRSWTLFHVDICRSTHFFCSDYKKFIVKMWLTSSFFNGDLCCLGFAKANSSKMNNYVCKLIASWLIMCVFKMWTCVPRLPFENTTTIYSPTNSVWKCPFPYICTNTDTIKLLNLC